MNDRTTRLYRQLLVAATVLAMVVLSLMLLQRPVLAEDPGAVGGPSSGAAERAVADATYATFRRDWYGHTRSLKIRRGHTARESVYSGCCEEGADLVFTVSRVRGTVRHATMRARLTKVKYWDEDLNGGPAPEVGTTVRLRLDRGVLVEPIIGAPYCNDKRGAEGVCGA